ncbi:MAG: hypothetical protein ACI4E1_07810 [Lachnospira sp.]
MVYAEINAETGKCFAVSDFGNSKVDKPTLIPLDNYDVDVLGKIWNGETWEDDPTPEPDVEIIDNGIPSSKVEELYENQLIIMGALADIAEMQMGVE